MAIKGIQEAPRPVLSGSQEAVDVAVEALSMLGLVQDVDEVRESVAADYAGLQNTNVSGEAYVQLPTNLVSVAAMKETLDSGTFPGCDYPETYLYPNLWTLGTEKNSYTDEEQGRLGPEYDGRRWQPHGRLALHNTSGHSPEPLLHFLDMPFDGKYAKRCQKTQLQAVSEAKANFEQEHPEYNLNGLNTLAFGMLALQRRIKGEPMPIEWGFMRIPQLDRKTVEHGSVVGSVNSDGGGLNFYVSGGSAIPGNGVGLSVGQNEA